jgi:hypothetical protein
MKYFILLLEALFMGLISWILCTIMFNLTINKNNKCIDKPFGLNFVFYSTGFLFYIIFEFISLS